MACYHTVSMESYSRGEQDVPSGGGDGRRRTHAGLHTAVKAETHEVT